MKKVFTIIFAINFLFTSALAQTEAERVYELFNFSNEATALSDNLISLSVNAVWLASELAGYTVITGTLTQSPSNPNYWTYSPTPNDKLVVVFADGSRIDFTFYSIDGYTEGDAEDFINSHAMDFLSHVDNYLNMRIVSNTWPEKNTIIHWQRTISGNFTFDGIYFNLTLQHNGTKDFDLGSGFAFYEYNETVTGNASATGVSLSLNDAFHTKLGLNSTTETFVKETHVWSNSSLTVGSTSYGFSNLDVFWVGASQSEDEANEGHFNEVTEAYNWSASGVLTKNGQQYGNVVFNGSVINGTSGPYLVVSLNGGNQIFLHPLLNPMPNGVGEEITSVSNFSLYQNYPNPFNPTTTIKYTIPSVIASPDLSGRSNLPNSTQNQQIATNLTASNFRNDANVQLIVYDILGRKIATLVNEKQSPGTYCVQFNASDLPSGVYFYTLQLGDFIATKKMILLK